MIKELRNQEDHGSSHQKINRRTFLKSSAILGGCLAASPYLTRYAQGAEAELSVQSATVQGGSMNLIREILANEVFPAVGCTEPISCAYACAVAAEQLNTPVEKIELTVDTGTFKNGAAVTIPNSQGQKGNVIAAAIGAMIAQSGPKLEILKEVTPETLGKAKQFVDNGHLTYRCKEDEKKFHVKEELKEIITILSRSSSV